MKRKDLLNHLKEHGCIYVREGGNHTIYINSSNEKIAPIPRHQEINKLTAKKICKELEIPIVKGA